MSRSTHETAFAHSALISETMDTYLGLLRVIESTPVLCMSFPWKALADAAGYLAALCTLLHDAESDAISLNMTQLKAVRHT